MLSMFFWQIKFFFFHTLLLWPVVLSQAPLKSRIDLKALDKLQSPTPEMSLNISSWPSVVLCFQPFRQSYSWWLYVMVAVLFRSSLFYLIWVAETAALKGFMFHCNSIIFWVTAAAKTQAFYFQFCAFFLVSYCNFVYPVSQSYPEKPCPVVETLEIELIQPNSRCVHNFMFILIWYEIVSDFVTTNAYCL